MIPFRVRLRALLSSVFAIGIVLVACSQAYCGDIDETTVRRLSRQGAFSADLRGIAAFRVPDKFRMVTEDKLVEFAEILNVALVGDELGVVLPNDKSGWICLVLMPKEDPLKGIDKKNLAEPSVRDATVHRPRQSVLREKSFASLFHLKSASPETPPPGGRLRNRTISTDFHHG